MKKKIKNIELTIDDIRNVKKISFVKDPAMEGEDFMYFNKDECFQKIDKELGIVTGLLMRPNKKIPRIDKTDGSQYTVSFSEETVRLASEFYLKDGNQGEANLEHKWTIDGVFLVESYIITDEKINNAVALGFKDVMRGDWWGSLKIINEDLKKMIKDGVVTGFSIEGQFVDAIVHMNEENFTLYERVSLETSDECCDEYDIIKLMVDNAHDYDKLKVIVDGYLEFGIWPPLHPNCVCRIVNGVWILHPEDSMAGPCPICKERADNFNSQPRTGSIRNKPLNMSVENLKTGVAHYTESGQLWTGPTHKDAEGRLMTGAVHSPDSEYLYHLEDLATIGQKFAEGSYDDYPQEAVENAKRALRYAEEYGWGSCGTPVGKMRANQLAKGEPISRETIARMSAFERQRQNSDRELGDGCGRLMWLAWGGDAGVEWAGRKLDEIDSEE